MSTALRLKCRLLSFWSKWGLLGGFAIGISFIPCLVQAGTIAWRKDLRRACREAAACRRPVLVAVTARWCGPCRRMHSETFPNSTVATRVNSQFIPVLLDADEQPEAVKSLGVDSFPTVVVISPEQRVMGRLTGFQSAAQLSARLASYQTTPSQPPPPPAQRTVPYRPTRYQSLVRPPAPRAPETKTWAQRTWDAIRASHAPTTLDAAVAFSTGH